MRKAVLLLTVVSALSGASLTEPGAASAAELSAAEKKRAADLFRDGERAFKRHEYPAAAARFEEANAIAPHPAALFNAARAHQKAGDLVRAANLCARYLRDAPANDSRRTSANALLAELRPKVGRISIETSADSASIDGVAVELDETFVDPGDHVVTARFGEQEVRRNVTVVAGSLERIVLEPPAAPPPSPEDPGDEPPAEDAPEQPAAGKPLPPTWFWVGVGATALLGGATVWSGLDTNSAREQYDKNPTPGGLDDGRSKQSRTNLLLGSTAVVAALTATTGLWLTEFGKKKQSDEAFGLSIGPGGAAVAGRF